MINRCLFIIATFLFPLLPLYSHAGADSPISFLSKAPDLSATNALIYWSEAREIPRPVRIHFMQIDLHNPDYEVFTMISDDPDGKGPADAKLEAPEKLATRYNAIAAINANAFQSLRNIKGETDTSWVLDKPVRITGIAASSGVVRGKPLAHHFSFWTGFDGKAHIGIPEANDKIKDAVSDWSGYLVHRGKVIANSTEKLHPRTLLGMDQTERRLILAVVDGRQPEISEGLNLYEAAQLMKDAGCHEAIALDGGGSSIMLAREQAASGLKILNNPADTIPRPVPVMLGVRKRLTGLAAQAGYLSGEFIFSHDNKPTPQCHASTIVETGDGLAAAWFGGTQEGATDVGIWFSRRDSDTWSMPVEIANGLDADSTNCYPCWNPVLFRPAAGPLMLFYKIGSNCSTWRGMLKTSGDSGRTWSEPQALPKNIWGPARNKPVELPNGTIICPGSTEYHGWRIHFESTTDLGKTWTTTGPIDDTETFGAIQPTILEYADGWLQALCRSKQKYVTGLWSDDSGKTWSKMTRTTLPNPDAAIDGITLSDGRHLLVYNHSKERRSPLNVALSKDGKNWELALALENKPGEFSYPAVIQTSDEKVHVSYTYLRKTIKHVVLDPAKF